MALSSNRPRLTADSPASAGREIGIFTLVLWLAGAVVGVLGFILPYERPHPPRHDQPVLVQQLQVELTQEPIPKPDSTPPSQSLSPPPMPDEIKPPPMDQTIAVAQPAPTIAFVLPVDGLTRVVDAQNADYRSTASNSASANPSPMPQPLTFGEGEGKQPAPEYPRKSVREGQEGMVVVRLAVDETGRVRSAEAASPSPWPLLNEAAVRTVRERWRFRSGPERLYDVPIRFELTK